jgi:hypothetical protein
MFSTVQTTNTDICTNGVCRSQGNNVQFEVPEEEKKDGPVTVSISAGRVTRADTGGSTGDSTVSRPNQATLTRAVPYNWLGYMIIYGPWVLLAAGVHFLGKRRGKNDEVNFGIYKGAMPLEMHTVSASKHVITTRKAKRRSDYLPAEVLAVERVPQEDGA